MSRLLKRSADMALLLLISGSVSWAEAGSGTYVRGPDDPGRAQLYSALRRWPEGGHLDPALVYQEALEHMRSLPRHSARLGRELPAPGASERSAVRAELATWEPLGPGNFGGRTRALLVHPENPAVLYAAGVSGGVWKTEDGGGSWRPLSDLLPNIAVNTMAMDPRDPDVIYAGTGEGYFREDVRGTALALRGAGILKTTDGGATWKRLSSTWNPSFRWVNKIVVSHRDPRRLYAGTRTGVWRSPDAGKTWKRSLATNVRGGCLDLALRSDRPSDVLFAACGTLEQATVYRNHRAHVAGSEWVAVLSDEGMGRTSLALAPSDQNTIYALSASYVGGPGGHFNGGLHAVFRSDAAGTRGSWKAVNRNSDPEKLDTILLSNMILANQVVCSAGSQDRYQNQGWFAAMIAVDPVDPEIVFVGGVDVFRSDDGGQSWGPITFSFDTPLSAHADHHVMVFHPDYDGEENQTAWLGNDGGVWTTPNARDSKVRTERGVCVRGSDVVWEALNHGYEVAQFYHGAAFPDGRRYIGGTQDNGTLLGDDEGGVNGWSLVYRGDGGYVAIDPVDPRNVYAESYSLSFAKSTDGGLTFRDATRGITENDFAFIVPYTMDPSDSRRLWLGGSRLWRTVDGAETWTAASPAFRGLASAVAVAPADPDRVLAGFQDGTIRRNDRALTADAYSEWPRIRPREGFLSSLAFDPEDPLRVYATYSTFGGRHVWASDDGGHSWQTIDGTGPGRLPNLPVHAILVDPTDSDRLFLGTDLGVFVSTRRGFTWAVERTGFANAVTEALDAVVGADATLLLFAFTHGRGAWRVEAVRP